MGRRCGNPPTIHCIPERVAEGAEDAAVKGSTIRMLMQRSHEKVRRAPTKD
jgi:hypothetical protein